MAQIPATTTFLQSTVGADGTLTLALREEPVVAPRADEVLVRVEASPVNPTDMGLMLAGADLSTLHRTGNETTATVPSKVLANLAGRLDRPQRPGSEGAGVVVAAGASAQDMIGRVISASGSMFTTYRTLRADDCTVLPDTVTPVQGAATFVNPLTALGFVETARLEGHRAIINTAAASNLGQMLVRLCLAEGIPLVSIVRRPEQVELLRGIGAEYVCDSSAPDFAESLRAAVAETGATLAFDAIGGELPQQILRAMNEVLLGEMRSYSHYGSPVSKTVYIYGTLDLSPITIPRAFGMSWNIGGWLLFPFLERIGRGAAERLRRRAAEGVTTTFASSYDQHIGLDSMIEPDVIRDYARRATKRKYLLDLTL